MDTAYDLLLSQRKSDNSGNDQRNVLAVPGTVVGFDSNRHPITLPYRDLSATGNYLLSGGTVAFQSGLTVNVSPATYLIQGAAYVKPLDTLLTAPAADATYTRVDVIVLNTSNTAELLVGIPSANPLKPQADPTTQLELTSYLLPAGATTLPITVTQIYLENVGPAAEWTASPFGTPINVNSLVNPRRGTHDIEGTAAVNGNFFNFLAPAPFDLGAYTSLTAYIAPKSNWPNAKGFTIQFLDVSNTLIGNPVFVSNGAFGLVSTGMTPLVYQQIVIPTSLFGLNGNPNTRQLRFMVGGGTSNIGFHVDDVFLASGLNPSAPAGSQNILGTANEITSTTAGNTTTISLPTALTFTGKTVTGGRFILPASTTSSDFLVLAHGVAPTTPTNGALWSTTAGFFGRVNGATVGPFGVAGAGATPAGADTQVQYNNSGAMGAISTFIFNKDATSPGLTLTGTNSTLTVQRATTAGYNFVHHHTLSTGTGWRIGVFPTSAGSLADTDYTFIYNNGVGNTRYFSIDTAGAVSIPVYVKDALTVQGATSQSYIQVINTNAANDSSVAVWRNSNAGNAIILTGTTAGTSWRFGALNTAASAAANTDYTIVYNNGSGNTRFFSIDTAGQVSIPVSVKNNLIVSGTGQVYIQAQSTGSTADVSLGAMRATTSGYAFTNYITTAGGTSWRTGLMTVAAGAATDTDYGIFYNNGGGNARYLTITIGGVVSIGTAAYPTAAGASGNVMTSNGTNWVSQAPAGGGSGTITSSSAGQIPVYTAATTIAGSTGFTINTAQGALNVSGTNPGYSISVSGVSKFLSSAAIGVDSVINGAVTDDVCFRTTASGSLLFSVDNGSSIGLKIAKTTGNIQIGPLLGGNTTSDRIFTAVDAAFSVVLSSHSATAANSANLILRRSRGTNAGPSYPNTGDTLGALHYSGWTNSIYLTSSRIVGYAEETWTNSAIGTYLSFEVTQPTTLSRSEAMRLNYAGLVVNGTLRAVHPSAGANNYAGIFESSLGKLQISGTYDATVGALLVASNNAGTVQHVISVAGSVVKLQAVGVNRLIADSTGIVVTGSASMSGFVQVGGAGGPIVRADSATVVGIVDSAQSTYVDIQARTISTSVSHFTNGTFTAISGTQVVVNITSSASDPYIKITDGTSQVFLQSSTTSGSVGTITNHPFTIRSFNAVVASFGPTLVAIPSAIFTVEGSGNVFAFNGVGPGLNLRTATDPSDAYFLTFETGGSVMIGSVRRVGGTNAVAFNTSSDQRLKTAITNFEGSDSGPLIDALQPRRFNWRNVPGTSGHGHIGFIAQEMAAADPIFAKIGAVSIGDSDPNPNNITIVWQRSDIMLIPILVAEIKALRTRVAVLEAFNPP